MQELIWKPVQKTLLETPLTALNRELGGRIVSFAGYAMPVQFEGIMAEHNWTRQSAGLFDVSHMGQRFHLPAPTTRRQPPLLKP